MFMVLKADTFIRYLLFLL